MFHETKRGDLEPGDWTSVAYVAMQGSSEGIAASPSDRGALGHLCLSATYLSETRAFHYGRGRACGRDFREITINGPGRHASDALKHGRPLFLYSSDYGDRVGRYFPCSATAEASAR
jgi:hypothetical protein